MIKTKKRGNLIIISGTTCAGKGTVIKELLKRNDELHLSISYTSRDKRKGDIDGVTYNFVTPEEFEQMIQNDEFLEYEQVHYGRYYGTPKKDIEQKLSEGKNVILEIDVKGANHVKEIFPETILIFILAPSMEIVKERIISRGAENPDEIIKRFEVAYREINEVNKYNYVVVNDILEDAVKKVEAILISEKCRVDRIEELAVSNKEEIIHEFLMDKQFNNEIKKIDE